MPPASPRDEPWFVRAFNRTWLKIYAHRDEDEAERNAPFVLACLAVLAGQRVLDLSCGAGRYARAFARRGLRVTGVDLSADLIEEARRRSPALPGSPAYYRADSRRLPFAGQFEGAVSMFTSFGYFEREEDDLAIFRGVARGLLPGGRVLLDFLNEALVRASLVPEEESSIGSMRLRFSRRIEETPSGPCVFKRIQAEDLRTRRLHEPLEERVRLYTLAEIDGLLQRAGLVPEGEPFGDLSGAPFGETSPRLVRLAVRR